ncbi:MAG: orotidine-5'-phosphate decarboxylase [Clostridia bacterium]
MSINILIEKIQEKNNPTVAGLDARPEYIPAFIHAKYADEKDGLKALSKAMLEFNKGLIDALCDIVPAVKPQSAYYELLGYHGVKTLKKTIAYAQKKGMYVIADVKRNDIGSTATAYAEAYLGTVRAGDKEYTPFGADSATVNAYLGTDGIKPFVDVCKKYEKSIFVLVKTSNPSSGEFQNKDMEGKPLYEQVCDQMNVWGQDTIGKYGYSEVGAVVGATYPEEQKAIRALIPHAYFLVPGYGAQGATGKDIKNAFNEDGLGAIVNSSRGLMCAWQKTGGDGHDYKEAARTEAIKMRDDIVANIK